MIKKINLLIVLMALSLSSVFGQQLTNNMDSVSYSFGILVANNLKSQGVDSLDMEALKKGMQDVFSGGQLELTLEEANKTIGEFMKAQQMKAFEGIIQEGKEFMEANGKREEVTTTASGLQYEVLSEGGEGDKPTENSKVTVHYTGKLLDGTVFDSSVERGQPASFPLKGVIGGWTEGVQLMTPGSKFRFVIPQELGYGARGAGKDIPPYATLIFDIELISIDN